MGCCLCRPITEVTEDPEVTLHTEVGAVAIIDNLGTDLISSASQGLLYVRGNRLCYESTVGSKLCCRHNQTSWYLSQLRDVRVVHGETVLVPMAKVALNPGLRVTFEKSNGSIGTLAMAMPAAVTFRSALLHHVGQNVAKTQKTNPLQNMVQ